MHTNDKIGDAVIRSALCFGLQESPLKPKQAVITTSRFAEYWACHPAVDEVVVVPNRKVDGALKTASGLAPFIRGNRGRFDVLVNFDLFCRVGEFYKASALRSKITIGHSKEMFRLFDYSVSNYKDGLNPRTPAERNRDLLSLFGVHTDEEAYRVHVPTGRSGLELEPSSGPRFLLNAYGQTDYRTFTRETLEMLCHAILEQSPSAHIYLNLPSSWPAIEGGGQLTTVKPFKTHWELFDFVDQMDAVVTPDTGMAHIAAGLGKPLFVIFSNVGFLRLAWRPMSDRLVYVCSKTDGHVNDLDWDEVREGIRGMLLSCPF